MGINEETATALCEVLRTYILQWGAEHVLVRLPDTWRNKYDTHMGPVRVEFVKKRSVEVLVTHPLACSSFAMLIP